MAMSPKDTRQEILNQCGDYVDHLISSMESSNHRFRLLNNKERQSYENHTFRDYIKNHNDHSNVCIEEIFNDEEKKGKRPDIKNRDIQASHKLKLMQVLIRTIPNKDNITAEDFSAFSNKFQEVKQELQAIRRNDTAVDQYLIPFLKGIAEILLTCTIVLAPLAYYGLYRTTGENMTARVEKLIPVLDDEPPKGEFKYFARSAL